MGLVNNASYEDTQKQRVQENLQRMKELGLQALSKDISESHTKSKPSKTQKTKTCNRLEKNLYMEARRSSRVASTPQPNYREVDPDFPVFRRSKAGRNPKRQRYISSAAMEAAAAAAETVQTSYPAFVKPMVRSHVSSCFWLGLPKSFCQQHMPNVDTSFLLEDDEGVEWECLYLAHKTGLSGGWRGFALAHNLEDGDAIVFERVKPTKFKLHIVRAFDFEQAEPVKQPPAKKHTKKNKVNNKLPFQPEGSELQRKVTGATVSRESIKKEHACKLERAEFTMERGKSARLNGRVRVKSEKTTNKPKLQAQYKSLDTKVKAEAKNGIQQEHVDARAGRLIRRTKSLIASQ